MRDRIYEILKATRPEFDFTSSSDFIEAGFLDSFDVVTIISELENEFNIVVDGLDVIPENFVSVDAIEELIGRSRSN